MTESHRHEPGDEPSSDDRYEPPELAVIASVEDATLGITEVGSDSMMQFS